MSDSTWHCKCCKLLQERNDVLYAENAKLRETLDLFFIYFEPDTEEYPGQKELHFNEFVEAARKARN